MKNIFKLAVGFLIATSSVAMADNVVTGVINTGNRISDSQLQAAAQTATKAGVSSVSSTASTSITPLSAATGITYYQIIDVISANYPTWEDIGSLQTSTVNNHGGAWIDVAVFQYGYGNPNSATLSGYLGNHYRRDLVCGSLSAPYFCGVGETATGFVDYFEFTGPQTGQYTSSASSVAYPYGTWTDSLYIQ